MVTGATEKGIISLQIIDMRVGTKNGLCLKLPLRVPDAAHPTSVGPSSFGSQGSTLPKCCCDLSCKIDFQLDIAWESEGQGLKKRVFGVILDPESGKKGCCNLSD